MLVTSSRAMGHISPPATSPGSPEHHHMPADLSPRSSNSSLISSNESLLNTSTSVPSPGAREIEAASPPRRGRGEGISALQCLENALGRSPFTLFPDSENEGDQLQLQQQITKSFAILGSPAERTSISSPNIKSASGGEDEEMGDDGDHVVGRPLKPAVSIGTPNASPTSTSGSSNAAGSVIFQCPLCAVVFNSRHDFNEHIVTHSQQHACPKCAFITSIEDELHHHVQDIHGVEDYMEMFSDDEVKTPKTNAQGKLKTFKCKHCEYRAVTKKEFWDHTKSHIREEKMLHCPKCPFVTEYKHHLEYHLRNHMGSKPYQCTKCSYSCVNKSMLNSHLKSHSNIYQYRCADCSYATKYCHSLKLHLRKYNHNPAMVLNPDGTPNPLPIIDVYGTRRGPKMKRPDPILEGLATTQPLMTSPMAMSASPKPQKMQKKTTPIKKDKTEKHRQQHDNRDLSPKPASSPRFISSMPNQAATPPLKKMREDSSGDSDCDSRIPPLSHLTGRATQLPQAPISPSSIAMILQRTNGNGLADALQRKDMGSFPQGAPNPLELYNVAQYLLNPMLHMSGLSGFAQQMATDQKATLLAHLLQQKMLPGQLFQQQDSSNDFKNLIQNNNTAPSNRNMVGTSPLDLRNPRNEILNFRGGNEESKKRKRKGKALRYERPSSSDNDDEDEEEALDFSNNNNVHYKDVKYSRKNDTPTDLSVSNGNVFCKYCEISFFDRELYNIHMNFHSGGDDPFLCRSCGKKTQNKIEFFKHLTTDPH